MAFSGNNLSKSTHPKRFDKKAFRVQSLFVSCFKIPRSTKTKLFHRLQCVLNRDQDASNPFPLSRFHVQPRRSHVEPRPFNGVLQDTRFVKTRSRAIPSCSNSAFNQDEAVFNPDQDVCSDCISDSVFNQDQAMWFADKTDTERRNKKRETHG